MKDLKYFGLFGNTGTHDLFEPAHRDSSIDRSETVTFWLRNFLVDQK